VRYNQLLYEIPRGSFSVRVRVKVNVNVRVKVRVTTWVRVIKYLVDKHICVIL
jgi:hypothetical protein